MIHSLSGGVLKDKNFYDFAKIEITEGFNKGDIYWYISDFSVLKENDQVLVPFGKNDTLITGKVLRIDKNISEQSSPVPAKRTKRIFKIIS